MALRYGNENQYPALGPNAFSWGMPAYDPMAVVNPSEFRIGTGMATPSMTPTPNYSIGLDNSGSGNVRPPNYSAPIGPMAPEIAAFTQGPITEGLSPQDALNSSGYATGDPLGVALGAAFGPEGGQRGFLANTFLNEKGGLNVGSITSLLGSIGSIYGAIKSYGLAKDSLNFSKEAFKTNLRNQTKSYNTALEDRAVGRASYAGYDDNYVKDYVNKNKL